MDISKFFEEIKQILEETIAKMPYQEIKDIKNRYYNKNKRKNLNKDVHRWIVLCYGV